MPRQASTAAAYPKSISGGVGGPRTMRDDRSTQTEAATVGGVRCEQSTSGQAEIRRNPRQHIEETADSDAFFDGRAITRAKDRKKG